MDIFTFETTLDGSPTLRIRLDESQLSEAMHSLKGAFSETLYIYGAAIEKTLKNGFAPSILSMGLGLGYVEILASALLLQHGQDNKNVFIESFEILPELRERILAWLKETPTCPAAFVQAYDQILERTAAHTGLEAAKIKSYLRHLYSEGRWRLREGLTSETVFNSRFGCICFDAFSSKSTPEVWSEGFLKDFLSKTADSRCVLSTYACTGNLKRALRDAGFKLEIRQGFSSKRDSTFAVRDSAP